MKVYRVPLLLLAIFLTGIAAAAGFCLQSIQLALIVFGVCALFFILIAFLLSYIQKHQQTRMDEVFSDNRSVTEKVIEDITIPALLSDMSGNIVWRNKAMEEIYPEKNLQAAIQQMDYQKPITKQIVWNNASYQVMHMKLERSGHARPLLLEYWLDRTEAVHYQRLYTSERPAVMLISLDNFEDMAGDRQFHGTAVLAEVEKLVSEMCREIEAIYCRYENGRFLCIAETGAMQELEKNRFALMEQARKIETGTGTPVSLSIAVGLSQRIAQSEKSARLAMELALGRGGDQAVIREGADYRFYGGKNQQDARQSRVKMRLFSKALRQLFESSADVFIMGHKTPDMDCIGAAMGIAACAENAGIRAHLVLEEGGAAVSEALEEMKRIGAYRDLIIGHADAVSHYRSDSVLVIVDTQRPATVECPKLLEVAHKVVVIDHHRRSADYIDDTTLHYTESRASSASEMVTEILQYFSDTVKPNAFTCSMLLSGISLDTKQFSFNVSSRTFEAAGYLRKNGAELEMVSSIFRHDLSQYVQIAKIVEAARVDDHGIAVAACRDTAAFSKLTAAKAANELLKIRGIIASFVLGEENGEICISGRSLGDINVQLILERLGGGGHLTMAGAQLKGVTVDEAETLLLDSIRQQA